MTITFQFNHSNPIYPCSFFIENDEYWCIDTEKRVLKNGVFFMDLPKAIIFSEDFPLFRKVSEDTFVLVEDCKAWLFNTQKQIVKSFLVDKGAFKLQVQAGKIIIGYDEGCYEHGENRLAIFNQDGILEYVSHNLGTEVLCICKKGNDSILVYSYHNPDVFIEINVFNFTQKHFYYPDFLAQYALHAMYYHQGMVYLAVETQPYPENYDFSHYEISIFKMLLSKENTDYELITKIPFALFIQNTNEGFICHNFVLQPDIYSIWSLCFQV
jgi:hypothetical protein